MSDSSADVLATMTASDPLMRAVKASDAPGKVTDAEFSKMTPAQRLDYARQFPQFKPSSPR